MATSVMTMTPARAKRAPAGKPKLGRRRRDSLGGVEVGTRLCGRMGLGAIGGGETGRGVETKSGAKGWEEVSETEAWDRGLEGKV